MTRPTLEQCAALMEEAAELTDIASLDERLRAAAQSLRAGEAGDAESLLRLKLERAYAENEQLCATLRDHECGPQRGYDSPGTAEQPSRRTAQNDRPDNAASRGQDSAPLAEDRIGQPPAPPAVEAVCSQCGTTRPAAGVCMVCEPAVDSLVAAADGLQANVSGILTIGGEESLRQDVGNTNVAVLKHWRDEVRAALANFRQRGKGE